MFKGRGANSYISVDRHKYQAIDDAANLINSDCWLAKIHIRHAYQHVGIHPGNFLATLYKLFFGGVCCADLRKISIK